MKRCPECGRDYNDDSLSFCLDDGAELLFGPAPAAVEELAGDEPATAVLHDADSPSEAATRAQIHATGHSAVLPRLELRPKADLINASSSLRCCWLSLSLAAPSVIGTSRDRGRSNLSP